MSSASHPPTNSAPSGVTYVMRLLYWALKPLNSQTSRSEACSVSDSLNNARCAFRVSKTRLLYSTPLQPTSPLCCTVSAPHCELSYPVQQLLVPTVVTGRSPQGASRRRRSPPAPRASSLQSVSPQGSQAAMDVIL